VARNDKKIIFLALNMLNLNLIFESKSMKKFIICFVSAVFLALPIFSALAQPSIGIKISPTRIEHIANPGETIEEELQVTNLSGDEKILYFYVRDFKSEGEDGKPKLLEPGKESEDGSTLASWIKADSATVKFMPNETKTVPFRVVVPANADPGGHYGAVVFANKPPKVDINSEDKGAVISVEQQVAGLLLFTVRGAIDERAEIKDFAVDRKMNNTPFDVGFTARIENNGNVHIKPRGMIEISNFFGEKKAVLNINEDGGNILPKSIRKFNSQWQGAMGFGKYKASLIFSYGTSPKDGGEGMKTTAPQYVYFWIMPWKIMGISIFIASILGLALLFSIKYYKRRAVARAIRELGVVQNPVHISETIHAGAPAWVIILIFAGLIMLIVAGGYFFFFA
jgi:hypothetical protein